jgi:hypothetical protein
MGFANEVGELFDEYSLDMTNNQKGIDCSNLAKNSPNPRAYCERCCAAQATQK